jgi:hypothetical protein
MDEIASRIIRHHFGALVFVMCYTLSEFEKAGSLETISRFDFLPAQLTPSNV